MTNPFNLRRSFAAAAVLLIAATGCVAAPGSGGTSRYQSGAASYYTQAGVPVAFPRVRTSNSCGPPTPGARNVLLLPRVGNTPSCSVNDRGPYAGGRIVDLQPKQFRQLGPISAGVLRGVEIRY